MPLFNYRLKPVEQIQPWGESPNQNLHWFGLTDGEFYIEVGDERLFSYSQEIMKHWDMDEKYSDYQVADFARSVLSVYGSAKQHLSDFFIDKSLEWQELADVIEECKDFVESDDSDDADDWGDYYDAFRWFDERSVDASNSMYFPKMAFYRIGENMNIVWDNRNRSVDGIPVWDTAFGVYTIPFDEYACACRDFCDGLLSDMNERINRLESGEVKAQIDLDIKCLREDHAHWEAELRGYLTDIHSPDVSWLECEQAYRRVVASLSSN